MRYLHSLRIASLALLGVWTISSCNTPIASSLERDPIDCVNPHIGNISHLLVPTYPTVHLPNSMLRVIPHRKDFTVDQLHGLPILLTSHRGEMAFSLSPLASKPDSLPEVRSFMYDHEQVTPYRYSVYLDDEQMAIAYAPSHQSAIYELTSEGDNTDGQTIVLHTPMGELNAAGKAISGYQQLNDSVRVYLYLEASRQPARLLQRDSLTGHALAVATPQGKTVALQYDDASPVSLRYGVSYISTEQARRNVEREIQTFEVDMVAKAGRYKWENALSKIEVEGGTERDREIFYTSLYRTYERMINISEDGQYFSASTGSVQSDGGIPFYTDDWIWDTYLAVHPLRALIDPAGEQAMLTSYIRMAEQTPEGWLPTFPEVTGDSHRMNGNHSIATFADAYAKGLTNFDMGKAYEQAKRTLEEKSLLPWTRMPREALTDYYHQHGYFPGLRIGEKETYPHVTLWEKRQSVAVSLAMCYDYWCLSQMAAQLGRDDEAREYLKRSYDYRRLFNYETAFFHPRDEKGNFIQPFDYEFSGGLGARDYYDENNAYTYRWDVKHNPADLIYLMGGNQAFIDRLDETFRTPLSEDKWRFYSVLPDQTGNVGQFSMGNEPSLHIPYLYNYAGAPWRTQRAIRRLLRSWFRSDLMGVPGDEDGGGLSAFVVFSMVGIYPVTPGLPVYNIGSPTFSRATLHLDGGVRFVITARDASEENIYIQSARLNGKTLTRPWLRHSELIAGGELVLEMGSRPNKQWGTQVPPPSADKIELDH